MMLDEFNIKPISLNMTDSAEKEEKKKEEKVMIDDFYHNFHLYSSGSLVMKRLGGSSRKSVGTTSASTGNGGAASSTRFVCETGARILYNGKVYVAVDTRFGGDGYCCINTNGDIALYTPNSKGGNHIRKQEATQYLQKGGEIIKDGQKLGGSPKKTPVKSSSSSSLLSSSSSSSPVLNKSFVTS